MQGYSAGPMSTPDPFMPSYYNPTMSFPYLGQGLGEGAWSNGGDATILPFGSYDYNGMFSGFGYPQFGWTEYSGSDYWSNGQQDNRKDPRYNNPTEDYYRQSGQMMQPDPYAMNGEFERDPSMNSVEQGMKGMTIGGDKGMDNGYIDAGQMNADASGMASQQVQVSAGQQASKKTSWAAIASQPARPQPKIQPRSIPRAPMNPNKQNMDIGTWDTRNNVAGKQGNQQGGRNWSAPRNRSMNSNYSGNTNQSNSASGSASQANNSSSSAQQSHPVLDKLKSANQYNPKDFNLNPKGARFFIIKSYSEDDIHRSIKYSVWCSTEHGNKRLDQAYKERDGKGPVYLFFSVNGSGHFCGMAQMMSAVDYNQDVGVWAQDKWKGQMDVKWIYVKDVPNGQLRHIRLENNENKPVTNSRDTQEVPLEKGKQVLKIIHNLKYTTSIFDDFIHYEKRQEEEGGDFKKNGAE